MIREVRECYGYESATGVVREGCRSVTGVLPDCYGSDRGVL